MRALAFRKRAGIARGTPEKFPEPSENPPSSARAPLVQGHRVGVVEGAVALAVAGSARERRDEIAPRALDRGAQAHALREPRGDRGGKRAAGAVGVPRLDAGAGENVAAVLGGDEVADRVAVE